MAMFIVFKNIDWKQTKDIFFDANGTRLTLATVFFILSKILSAYRLNIFFQNISLIIKPFINLKLYWLGMFYNLFLPGGIGGDGYKVYLINKQHNIKIKLLIQAILLDRLSGLVALLFWVGISLLFLNINPPINLFKNIITSLLLVAFPLFWIVIRYFFNTFSQSYLKTSGYSILVQLFQIISAYLLLTSLGIKHDFLAYLVLFLISSIVSILPFTIGGIGARELTFILGYQYLGINENAAIAFSLMFFVMTAFVSLFGFFVKNEIQITKN